MKTESFTEHYSYQKHWPELALWKYVEQEEIRNAALALLPIKGGFSKLQRTRGHLRKLAKMATYSFGYE